MTLEAIGNRIEEEKLRLHLKNTDICVELDIHPNTYRNYESGRRDMPCSLLAQLSTIGFDIMYILTARRLDELKEDRIASVSSGHSSSSSGMRLVPNQTPYESENTNDVLISTMSKVEDALQKTGAIAKDDYTYVDLANIAANMIGK